MTTETRGRPKLPPGQVRRKTTIALRPCTLRAIERYAAEEETAAATWAAEALERAVAERQETPPAKVLAREWIERAAEGDPGPVTDDVLEHIHMRLVVHGPPEGMSSVALLRMARERLV